MPITYGNCTPIVRVNKNGEVIETEYCKVEGSRAVLIFKNGALQGVTGNPTKDEATKLAGQIGKAKTNVQKITL